MWLNIGTVILGIIIIALVYVNRRGSKSDSFPWALILAGGIVVFGSGIVALFLSKPESSGVIVAGILVGGLAICGSGVWGIGNNRINNEKINFKWLIPVIGGLALAILGFILLYCLIAQITGGL